MTRSRRRGRALRRLPAARSSIARRAFLVLPCQRRGAPTASSSMRTISSLCAAEIVRQADALAGGANLSPQPARARVSHGARALAYPFADCHRGAAADRVRGLPRACRAQLARRLRTPKRGHLELDRRPLGACRHAECVTERGTLRAMCPRFRRVAQLTIPLARCATAQSARTARTFVPFRLTSASPRINRGRLVRSDAPKRHRLGSS
jgi:hypothetical protein